MMIAIDDAAEITVQSTAKSHDLASDESIYIFNEPIATGLTTHRIIWYIFVTSICFGVITYSY